MTKLQTREALTGARIWHSRTQEEKVASALGVLRRHQALNPATWPGGREAHAKTERLLANTLAWLKTPEAEECSRRELERLQEGEEA